MIRFWLALSSMILDRICLCHSTSAEDRSQGQLAGFRKCKVSPRQGWNRVGMIKASHCSTRTFAAYRLRRIKKSPVLAGLFDTGHDISQDNLPAHSRTK